MPGRRELWLLGDNFTAISYRKHFRYFLDKRPSDLYCEASFEVSSHGGSRYASSDTNILSRIHNSLVGALNKSKWLPEYLAVILDDDLVKYLDFNRRGISTLYGNWIQWLASKINEVMEDRLGRLPEKAKSSYFIYWILAPLHVAFGEDNLRRIRFNQAIVNAIKEYPLMCTVILKEFWNESNERLVMNGTITEAGLDTYWRSFDLQSSTM